MNLLRYKEPFFEYLKNIRGYSPQTIKTYNIAISLLLDEHEIEKRGSLYIVDIMALRLKLSKHSKRSISTKISAIRSFIKYIKTQHQINLKLKSAQSIKVPQTLPKPIKHDDIIEVLNSINQKDRLIIKMLYGLGLRVSELSNLLLSNISNSWIRVEGKGQKTREIPIVKSLDNDIKTYIDTYKPHVYLFEDKDGNLSDSKIRYIVNKSFKKHGIKATPHQLRHSFASDLLAEGARVSDVSELLGHSSMATTQIYTKLTNSTKLKNYLKAHPLD